MPSGLRAAGVVACALPLLFVLTGLARAQDVAAAEDLYNRGVADFRAGRYEAACSEISASYRMDPLPGALFTLATCETRIGLIASAAAHYQDFLQLVATMPADQQAVQSERKEVATKERAALLADVPTIRILIDGRLPPGAVVRRDNAVLDAALLGTDLPVDPGDHVIVIEGGAVERRQQVSVARREHRIVSMDAPPPSLPPPPPQVPQIPPDHGAPWRGALIATAIVAAAGVGGGSVAGGLAISEKNTVDRECNGPACSAAGKQASDVGRTEALVSTIAFGVGVAGAVGLVAVLLSGRGGSPAPNSVVLTDGGIGLRF
jgi:hypothetical protein